MNIKQVRKRAKQVYYRDKIRKWATNLFYGFVGAILFYLMILVLSFV